MRDSKKYSFDSRAPLTCDSRAKDVRSVGVVAGIPFHHTGMSGAEYVDVQRQTVQLSTITWGNLYPVEVAEAAIGRATLKTISELEAVIDELISHRDRLRESLNFSEVEARLLREGDRVFGDDGSISFVVTKLWASRDSDSGQPSVGVNAKYDTGEDREHCFALNFPILINSRP